jgi:hypothetical protein
MNASAADLSVVTMITKLLKHIPDPPCLGEALRRGISQISTIFWKKQDHGPVSEQMKNLESEISVSICNERHPNGFSVFSKILKKSGGYQRFQPCSFDGVSPD